MAGWFAAVVGLFGCDEANIDKLVPGVASEADVTRAFGTPTAIYERPIGGRTLEFARAPEGSVTYFADIGPDGRLARPIENVLDEAHFARIVPGLTQDEVRRVLGTPSDVERYALKPTELIWTWRWLLQRHDRMVFSAHFGPDGRVQATSQGVDPRTMRN